MVPHLPKNPKRKGNNYEGEDRSMNLEKKRPKLLPQVENLNMMYRDVQENPPSLQLSQNPLKEKNRMTAEEEARTRQFIRDTIENTMVPETREVSVSIENDNGLQTGSPQLCCTQCKTKESFSLGWIGKELALCTNCVEFNDKKIVSMTRTLLVQDMLSNLLSNQIHLSLLNPQMNNRQPNCQLLYKPEVEVFDAATMEKPGKSLKDFVAQHNKTSSNNKSGSTKKSLHDYNPDCHLMSKESFTNLNDSIKEALLKLPLSTTVSIRYEESDMLSCSSTASTIPYHSSHIDLVDIVEDSDIVSSASPSYSENTEETIINRYKYPHLADHNYCLPEEDKINPMTLVNEYK